MATSMSVHRWLWLMLIVITMALSIDCLAEDKTYLNKIDKPFPAADFSLKGEDGKQYTLSSLRGKVVVINFWATWCPPCRFEMPSMEKAWLKLKQKNIVLLGINVGEDSDTIFEFTGNYPVTFPLLLDLQGEVINQYPVRALPTSFVINPEGMVTHRAIGGRDWSHPNIAKQLLELLE